jgi:1-acyl-sn-glycerol-3-phosphate acyltransferase
MKAVSDPEGFRITKGKTTFVIMPGTDRYPVLPVRIKYENTIYPLKIGLIKAVNAFKECYSEEQVLEKLLELI